MSRSPRRVPERALLLAFGLALAACERDFPLGAWDTTQPSATVTSTGSTDPPPPPPPPPPPSPVDPQCTDTGTPGPFNTAGMGAPGTTTLQTDWTWPAPVDSLEWDVVIEQDPPTNGYYFAHKFSWVNGLIGFLGIQAHGGYADPSTAPPSGFVKMVLFWIAGPPSQAELGDVTEGARTGIAQGLGGEFMTIHVKLEWVACHVYHLRVAPQAVADTGEVWYGAWISDRTLGTAPIFLGRILVPADWGQLSASTTTYTQRIDNAQTAVPLNVNSCTDPEPTSGIFGALTANDGQVVPVKGTNQFVNLRCPTSRFTALATGVRHEIGVRPTP